jgi:hypothetical protein
MFTFLGMAVVAAGAGFAADRLIDHGWDAVRVRRPAALQEHGVDEGRGVQGLYAFATDQLGHGCRGEFRHQDRRATVGQAQDHGVAQPIGVVEGNYAQEALPGAVPCDPGHVPHAGDQVAMTARHSSRPSR